MSDDPAAERDAGAGGGVRGDAAEVEALARLRAARGGLCATCRHARGIASSRGSSFLRCMHPELPKYPPQPVVRCEGHEARDEPASPRPRGDATTTMHEGNTMSERDEGPARVGVIMGSRSDWDTMRNACAVLDELEVPYETRVVSAHRTPDAMFDYAAGAAARGIAVIVAGAGGAAHLPGMVAAKTELPVVGVPVRSRALSGMDSLLSIVQMPAGVPVATMAIGTAGATNAGLFAARLLALGDDGLRDRLRRRSERERERSLASSDELR